MMHKRGFLYVYSRWYELFVSIFQMSCHLIIQLLLVDCSGMFLLQRFRTRALITLMFFLAGMRKKTTAAAVHKKIGLSRGTLPSLCPWSLRNNTLRGWGFDCAGCTSWMSTHIRAGKWRQTHLTKIIPLAVVCEIASLCTHFTRRSWLTCWTKYVFIIKYLI